MIFYQQKFQDFTTQCDVREILNDNWEMMIAFPPCDHLAISGAKWFAEKQQKQIEALEFVRELYNAPIERICIENPIGILSTQLRKPDQIVHPYMFGDNFKKGTCLWLKNLPLLKATDMRYPMFSYAHTQVRNSIDRSRTFPSIARAMASQWG